MGNTIIFPAFFFVNDGATPLEKGLAYISDVALPAFGIAMFFLLGLIFSLRKYDKFSWFQTFKEAINYYTT